jgi:hypothetical protein
MAGDGPGYVTGAFGASVSPRACLIRGTIGMLIGPTAPMTMDQKRAGCSRAAQRQYRMGPAQKRGDAADIVGGPGIGRG